MGCLYFFDGIFPQPALLQEDLLEVLPELKILPLRGIPGSASLLRNVEVRVDQWEDAWEVRRAILENGGELANRWKRDFRWKDMLDHHLWAFEVTGLPKE